VQQLSAEQIQQIRADAAREAREQLQQELSPRLSQLDDLSADLQQRRDAEAAAQRQAEEAAEAQRRAEQTALERVQELENARQADNQRWQDELARRDTLLLHERRLSDLTAARSRLLAEAGDTVMPHLHQYVTGNTEDELRASIAAAQQTSEQIANDAREAMASQQQQAVASWRATPTATVTQPVAAGMDPVNEGMGQQQGMTLDELAALTPQDYARLRPQLLSFAGGNPNAGQGKGMYS
jgi:DNA repair exonuclease SbcCD ATPase subunit